ncbi:MAG: flagella basal body P-ring formation protein FlgA [Spirochaetes bacterium]|nr:flagella basal body P-ring formation protein FlgA [Spirochaetota bacterium]
MRRFNGIIALLLLFIFSSNGFAYTRLYLMSDVTVNSENVKISDICKVEGDNVDEILDIIIPPELYIDKMIDNKRLYDFLNSNLNEKVFVFGTGVKIKHNFNLKNRQDSVKPVLVKRGDMITLSIRKNAITIEVKGKALNNGCEKDEVNFKLSSGKVLKGKIISEKEADVFL